MKSNCLRLFRLVVQRCFEWNERADFRNRHTSRRIGGCGSKIRLWVGRTPLTNSIRTEAGAKGAPVHQAKYGWGYVRFWEDSGSRISGPSGLVLTPHRTSSLGENFRKFQFSSVAGRSYGPPHRRAVPDKHDAKAPQRESRQHPYPSFPNCARRRAKGRGRGHECLVRGL
jgi:hypothetical protein